MRTIAMVLVLQWLAISPAVAQDADDDPQIGAHLLSEWRKLLCDEDPDTRGSAAVALGKTRAEAGTPLLIKALDDKHWSVPGKAAYGLGLNATDDAIEALIRTIKDDRKSGDLRGDAAFSLGIACRRNRKHTEKAIPVLIAALQIKTAYGYGWEMPVQGIVSIGHEAVPALIAAIKNANRYQGSAATGAGIALQRIGQPAAPAVIQALNETLGGKRARFAKVLGYIGSAEAVPALIKAVEEDDGARRSAAFALGRIGPDAAAAIPALIEALKDDEPGDRSGAVRALRHMGPKARIALPEVIERLADDDRMVRSGAAAVLREIGGPEIKAAVPVLIKTLSHQSAYVRKETVKALGGIGPAARVALPALKQLTKDSDPHVAKAATEAIGRIEK